MEGLGFPKIMGTFLGVPIIRTIVFWVYIGVGWIARVRAQGLRMRV